MTAAVPSWDIVGPRSTDADLVRAAAAGDRQAFAVMYDRYANRLHDFCAGMLADRDAAADCVQDAFLTAATCLADLREPDKLRAWLYGIARHKAMRRIRDRRREHPTDELPEVASGDAGPDTMAGRSELANLIAEAAGGLSDRDRSVLELAFRHGLDGPELAEALGVSQTNANTMVYRLRETIEKCLGALLVARRARTTPNRCPELAAMLRGWDGQFTILMRKRIARHIESCHSCDQERRRMVNPVALLGAAPVFIPAPAWLRDRTLHEIQLTCSGTGMTSTAPPTQSAPTGRYDTMWHTTTTPVDRTPQTAGNHMGYEDEDDDERRQRRLLLLVGLFVGIPLAALVLTIAWVYLPNRAVNPSGVTGPVPPSTSPAPVGPLTTVAPPNSPPPSAPAAGTHRSSAPTVGPLPASAGPRVPSAGTAPQPLPTQQPNVLAPQPAPEGPLPPPLPNVLAPQPPLLPNVLAPPPAPAAPPLPNMLAPQPPLLPNIAGPLPAQQPTVLAPVPAPPPSAGQVPPGLGDSGLIPPEPVIPEPDPVLIPPPR
jgi:RNA polymerase sigma factor (sigma-70 family)